MPINDSAKNRWALADIASAVDWAEARQHQGISVALDPLGEYAQSNAQAEEATETYLNTLKTIKKYDCTAALAIKPSALGLNFSHELARDNLQRILLQAQQQKTPVEIDIEGTPTVEAVCQLAKSFAEQHEHLVLALQAYLNRTGNDLAQAMQAGLKIRLVKGAYQGDTSDFADIQQRFLQLFEQLLLSGRPFDIGTHDPELISSIKQRLSAEQRQQISFGFLKGLADQTKLLLREEGYQVAEYVPFGSNRRAYEMRRHNYLKRLAETGRQPVP